MSDDSSGSAIEVTRVLLVDPTDVTELAPGTVIGRYVVLEAIGAGGMGRVYRAHDPTLDREVALKLLRHRGTALELERMRREAMAMAQLSHPNVLPVYAVDEREGQPVLVMELVQGRTLEEWLRERDRDWPAILSVFMDAGRGLQAAHAAGIVHRDFKPANVLVGDDGRVRVMDFGLALAGDPRDPSSSSSSSSMTSMTASYHGDGSRSALPNYDLTAADKVVGTPAYMPPEQLRGDPVGPAADQYAFCVSLWEAASGQRPFSPSVTISASVLAEREQPPEAPPAAPWPVAVRSVLLRGLRPRPEERFASMDALLDALRRAERGPRRGRWRLMAWGAAAGLAVIGVAVLGDRGVPCPSADQWLVGVWDADVRARTAQALESGPDSHAAETWERLAPVLDDYGRGWAEHREAACRAIDDPSEATGVDARIHCLEERRYELSALVESLADADADAVGRAVERALTLTPVASCDDPRRLTEPLPSPDQAPAVDAARERLARLRATQDIMRLELRVEAARALLADVEPLGYDPLTIDARILLGEALGDQDSPEAIAPLERAYFDAIDHGLEPRAAQAATMLAKALGVGLGRYDDALRWVEHARVVAERTDDPRLRIGHTVILGHVQCRADAYPACLETRERALEMIEQLHGADSIPVARAQMALASPLSELSRYDRALGLLEHAQQVLEDTLGPRHPEVSTVLLRRGNIYRERGELDQAEECFTRALTLLEAVFGPGSPRTVDPINNLGAVAYERHDFDAAERHLGRALELQQAHVGERHYSMARQLVNLAVVDRKRGRVDKALERLDLAIEITEDHFGRNHPLVWMALNNMGNLHEGRGELARAEQLHAEALAMGEAIHGPDSSEVGSSLMHLGNIKSKRGQHAEGIALLDRAVDTVARVEGARSPDLARAYDLRAHAHRLAGQYAESLEDLQQALPLNQADFGPDHPKTLFTSGTMGVVLLEQGRVDEALAWLEPALDGMTARDDLTPDDLALFEFSLARALWTRPSERPRARRLAHQALEHTRASTGDRAVPPEQIERWLGDRG